MAMKLYSDTDIQDIADAIRTKNGSSDTYKVSEMANAIEDIPTGSTPIFTGHYDTAGLTAIGWSQSEIDYYNQNGVQWNSESDSAFVLTNDEKSITTANNSIRFLPKTISSPNNFENYSRLIAIPVVDTNSKTNFARMFVGCHSLTTIPLLNTSAGIDFQYMFSDCYSLTTIPQIDTSNSTSFASMFRNCCSLITIPELNVLKGVSFGAMFYQCYSLKNFPSTNFNNGTNFTFTFSECWSLVDVGLLNMSKAESVYGMFDCCYRLTVLKGFQNLGKAYSTSQSANYSNYKLNLSASDKLMEQSIINVLNNLYNIAAKGCRTQTCQLGSTNLAKLTSAEGQTALLNAQAKGWTIS